MNEPMDQTLAAWLREGPDQGPGDGLEHALAATRTVRQRPGWTLPERWLPVRLMWRPVAVSRVLISILALALLVGVLVGAAMLAGSEPRLPEPLARFFVNNDPIPLSETHRDSLARLVAGYGFGMEGVANTAPLPRVSPEQATTIAGTKLLQGLRDNAVPAQDVTVPDGLVRRTYVDPKQGLRANVWVVVYVWRAGFNCNDPSGGPGPCAAWDAYFVDDQTGELVTTFGLMTP